MTSTKGHQQISLGKTLRGQLSPFRIVLIYTIFAGLWIGFSDTLLTMAVDDPRLILQFSMVKGFLFVLVTALLLWIRLRVWREPVPSNLPLSTNKPSAAQKKPPCPAPVMLSRAMRSCAI